MHLVLTDALVPEPLIKDFIFESAGASHNTLLDVSNGGGVLHDLNHAYNDTAIKTGGKYHTMAVVFSLFSFPCIWFNNQTYSVSSGDAAIW